MLGKQWTKCPTDPSTLPYESLDAGKRTTVTTGQCRKSIWHVLTWWKKFSQGVCEQGGANYSVS